MGVNNRQRRKDEQRRRDRQHQQRASAGRRAPKPPDPVEVARQAVLEAAIHAHRSGELGDELREALVEMIGLLSLPVIDDAFGYWEERALESAWDGGWQPADVVRIVRRRCSPAHVRSVVAMVLESGRRRPEVATDRRWAAQLDGLEGDAGQARRSRWGAGRADRNPGRAPPPAPVAAVGRLHQRPPVELTQRGRRAREDSRPAGQGRVHHLPGGGGVPHRITRGGLAISNYAGHVAGRSAADLARLGAGEELSRR